MSLYFHTEGQNTIVAFCVFHSFSQLAIRCCHFPPIQLDGKYKSTFKKFEIRAFMLPFKMHKVGTFDSSENPSDTYAFLI